MSEKSISKHVLAQTGINTNIQRIRISRGDTSSCLANCAREKMLRLRLKED